MLETFFKGKLNISKRKYFLVLLKYFGILFHKFADFAYKFHCLYSIFLIFIGAIFGENVIYYFTYDIIEKKKSSRKKKAEEQRFGNCLLSNIN